MNNSVLLNILLLSPLTSALLIFLLNISTRYTKQTIYTLLALSGSGLSAMIALYISYYSYFEQKLFVSNLFSHPHIAF